MTADRDPGLQPERTRLAWVRTTLSYTVATVLAARTALRGGASPAGIAVCVLCFGFWLGFVWVAHRRVQVLATADRPAALTSRHAAAAVLCAAATAACAVAIVL
ncbi:DUF202 domain-containing protein [Streptomyces sp. NPDC006012]|uniref:DUF202 domain-containing protein n=1 Tax=Streptomyces sp. NPDC006012 TaxID=3364739 RepID=UPI0036896AE1